MENVTVREQSLITLFECQTMRESTIVLSPIAREMYVH